MVQAVSASLTLQEFLQLPETKPASEYIDGQVIQKAMPKGKHSVLQTQMSTVINAALQPGRIAWAFSELRSTYPAGSRSSVYGGRSIVSDVSVFIWSSIPCDQNGEISNTFELAPDWTIEVLSPDQNQTRVTKNILHCLKHGTQMGWLIDPEEQTVLVYLPPDQVKVFDQLEEDLPFPSFAKDLQLTVGELFGWLVVR